MQGRSFHPKKILQSKKRPRRTGTCLWLQDNYFLGIGFIGLSGSGIGLVIWFGSIGLIGPGIGLIEMDGVKLVEPFDIVAPL